MVWKCADVEDRGHTVILYFFGKRACLAGTLAP